MNASSYIYNYNNTMPFYVSTMPQNAQAVDKIQISRFPKQLNQFSAKLTYKYAHFYHELL